MNKYERLKADLASSGTGTMKCFGNSMLPVLSNPSHNTYEPRPSYSVGDIVFAKVRNRFIDAHLVAEVSAERGYRITNMAGFTNGWTKEVYAKVVRTTDMMGRSKDFA